jgi:hypothetical protein
MTLQMPTLVALNRETAQQLNDVEISASNIELDALVLANDERNKIGARMARLASLNPIERAKQIKATAKELGVPVAAVKQEVKQAEGTTDTKGQGRPLEFPALERWPDAINGATLLAEMCAAIRQYLILPNGSGIGSLGRTYTRLRMLRAYTPPRHHVTRKGMRQDNYPRCAR